MEFQDCFLKIMEKAHAGEFFAVRPYGNAGDLKCDGYLIAWRLVC